MRASPFGNPALRGRASPLTSTQHAQPPKTAPDHRRRRGGRPDRPGRRLTAFLLRDARTEVADHRTDAAEAIEGARIAVTGRLPEAQAVNFGKVFSHWDDEIPSV